MSLKNQSIAAASILIYEETKECTFYLEHKDLKRVVAGLGGTGADSINGKTSLVVLGDTSRERTKRGEDKWHTSGRCKQIEKQQQQHDTQQRKLPFRVVEFKAFVKEHGLEEVVERELVTAHWETEKNMEKDWKAPEVRTASQVNYYTLVENSPGRVFASGTGHSHRVTMGSSGPMNPAVRGLHRVITHRGGIVAVKQMVLRESRENLFNRGYEYYDSDEHEVAYCRGD